MQVGPYYLEPSAQAGLLAECQKRRADLIARRALRATAERLAAERRASTERRSGFDRRFATMDDKLAAAAHAQSERRFSGKALTDFGLLGL